ncbi:MAG: hypothetical protein ABIQ72_15770 [Usitatibacter sp.]
MKEMKSEMNFVAAFVGGRIGHQYPAALPRFHLRSSADPTLFAGTTLDE